MIYLQDYTPYSEDYFEEKLKKQSKEVIEYFNGRNLRESLSGNDQGILVLPYALNSSLPDTSDEWVLWNYDGKSIFTQNLVGFIGYGKTNISIGSRFSTFTSQKYDICQDYFLVYLLQKTLGITLFDSLKSSSSKDSNSALDFLFLLFPPLFKKALSQGFFKRYVHRQYNDANIRGVIDVNRHIRFNIPTNGKVAYRTREFSYDNPVTQLIRHTIEYLRRHAFGKTMLTNDVEMRSFVQQIIQATPSYVANQRQQVIAQNSRPVSHPLYTHYAMLQQLCLRILRYEKLSYGENKKDEKIHGVLIDINWLWEEYVAQVLSENSNFEHYTRKDAFNLLQKENGEDFQPVIPDYLGKVDGKTIVADAKYMFLNNSDYLRSEKAMAVYYKTIMYMYRFKSKNGMLLYPYKSEQIETNLEIPYIHYKIIDTDGRISKIGLEIPQKTEYRDFIGAIKVKESEFANNILEQIK